MDGKIGLAQLAELGSRTVASSAEAIAAVVECAGRLTGTSVAVVSEVTWDGRYVFRALESTIGAPVASGAEIPYPWSLCSRVHAGESPATVPDTRRVPALWASWLRLKERLGVDWDVLAFCTRDIRLPDGTVFGTVCLHDVAPRSYSEDEQALLTLLARLLAEELGRERAAARLGDALDALELAERRRVELAEELQHELRAPLQVIDGYAEGMLDGVVARDDEHVVLVRHEAGRAMRLLDDVIELARLEAPGAAGGDETVAAHEVVIEIRDRLAPLARGVGVDLVVDASPAGVRLPRRRLEQLLVNLVRNALRAAGGSGGSRVVLFVRRDGDRVAIGVEDDGPGIDEAERVRVFDRFYRGRSGRDAGTGSGLGLTIARRITEAAGGDIAAEPLEPRGVRIVARVPEGDPGGGEAAMQTP